MLHPEQQFIKDMYGKEPETLDEIAEACISVISQTSTPLAGFAWKVRYQEEIYTSHYSPIKHEESRIPGFYGRIWLRYAEEPNFMSMSSTLRKTLTYSGSGGGGAYDGLWQPICHASYVTAQRKRPGVMNSRLVYKYPRPRCFSFDYRFFLDEFPALCNDVGVLLAPEIAAFNQAEEESKTWHKLKNEYYKPREFSMSHYYAWEDKEIKAQDDAFLKEYHSKENVIA